MSRLILDIPDDLNESDSGSVNADETGVSRDSDESGVDRNTGGDDPRFLRWVACWAESDETSTGP